MRKILSPVDCVIISKAEFRLILKELPGCNRYQTSTDLWHNPIRWSDENGDSFAMEFDDCVYVHNSYMALR